MTDTTSRSRSLDDLLPPLTYRDLLQGLESIAQARHRDMVPYLVSALREQAPFLTGRMVLFEILRSGNCLADDPFNPTSLAPNASPLN